MKYVAETKLGRRIELPDLESFDGAEQASGRDTIDLDRRMKKLAEAIYGHLLLRVIRVDEHVVVEYKR